MTSTDLTLLLQKFPSWVPQSSVAVNILLLATSFSTASVLGYDASMMNALNILPSYTDYFKLNNTTIGLNSAIVWVGAVVGGILWAKVPDLIGRKPAMFYSALVAIVGTALQAAAQNIAMFLVARFVLGLGIGGTYVACPTFLAETLPQKYRSVGLGAFTDLYYVGALLSSGITYGTSAIASTWAWRIPSILQIIFTALSLVTILFVPESPRWYAFHGRREEALLSLAQVTSNGDTSSDEVQAMYRQILETIEFERHTETPSVKEIVTTPTLRKRMLIILSVAVFSMLTGSNIFSYYLGSALDNAGITDSTLQLEINIILNAWCLVIAVIGTLLADKLGRKTLAAVSTGLCTVFLFIIGVLTKFYGDSTYQPAIYANVAMMFLSMGAYSFAWTPLVFMYPPELLSYRVRSVGIAFAGIMQNATLLIPLFAFPIAMDKLGWKLYMVNGAWNVFELFVILFYWVETKGQSLEEASATFDDASNATTVHVAKVIYGQGIDLENSKEEETCPKGVTEVTSTKQGL